MLRNRVLGRNKIQDRWAAIPYRTTERISPDSPLYRVQRFDGQGQPKVVHRTAMLDINDVRAPAMDTVHTPLEPEAFRVGVAAGCKETTSEGSSTPVNRWVIVNSGDESHVAPVRDESDNVRDMHNGHAGSSMEYNRPVRLHSPVRQAIHDLRRNSDSEEEESQIPNLATDDTLERNAIVFPEERVFFFCRILHTMFSHLRAHAFARSVTVAMSSSVHASSSRVQLARVCRPCPHRAGIFGS